jgi:hypothetical protein
MHRLQSLLWLILTSPARSWTLARLSQRPTPSTTRTCRRSQRPRPSTTRIFSDEVDDVECAPNDDECVANLSDEDYVDGAGALEVIDDDAPDLTKLAQKNKLTKASWKLSLSIGRETGTWMPEEWAASGARLLLPITVEFDSEPYPGEPEALVGQTCFRCRPVGESSFVGVGGKVTVPVRGGAWAIQPPKPPQKPALLRFWLEFPEEAKRNDVTLPPGRVFFTAPVWQEIELERGAEARKEARERYEEAETKSASLADEAVKANPLAKIFGLRKQVLALDEKNAAMRRLERVERYLGGSRDGGAGPFPGLAAGASLTLGTTGGLVVKRTPRIGVGTEYHILGKFQAQAAASDG